MKYFLQNKLLGAFALLFLVGCGGGGGGSTPIELTVASFSEFKLTENSTSGAWVIDASTNKSSAITYSITGGPDASFFSMSGETLSFKGSANYEAPSDLNTDGVYEVYVQTSSGTAASTQTVYVRVTDAPEAPSISTSSITSVAENSLVLTTISAVDEDRGSSVTYSLLDSSGSKDEGLLAINASTGQVSFVTAPDFESPTDLNSDNTIDFTVVASDGSLSSQADFSVAITNVNDAPSFGSTTEFSIGESTTIVGTISVTDQDSSASSISFSLATGDAAVDDGLLAINSSTGVVSFLSAPNFESPSDQGADNTYNFTVIASDGSASSSIAMSVAVSNVNESPLFSVSSSQTYVENSGVSISVAANDQDASASVSYSLSGLDASKFSISSSGSLSFASAPDYENPSDNGLNNVFNVSVTASDGSSSSSVSLVISLSDDTTDNFGIQLPANVALAELQKENE
ncbi:cadherin repeat domain-containing protein [Gammaproteobacteria bacterium]|jgi:VCBS repeat-containing protein|nr:cadherin repeat domain-containing protein [Gammaproteobacteria bacterium]MDB9901449.1 cadherin repeat domain-containing protein [Gammaproteobacteria bacterium]MDC1277308.1 cadherin repeat domain-containing protein [Gammaproteobacteria bacterium]MDC1360060.1 cadherin repeat domain-containing protein [Gammaproteobacteria bacterium]MDC3381915.1 cadherin repeat domain-containing protein [Gammaproteobacteria bacterium]